MSAEAHVEGRIRTELLAFEASLIAEVWATKWQPRKSWNHRD
jgi:hypothetical protein